MPPQTILPTPPTETEKYWFIDRNSALLYVVGYFCTLSLSYGAYLFVANDFFSLSLIAGFFALSLFWLTLSYTIALVSPPFKLERHKSIQAAAKQTWQRQGFPSVDVFLPSAGEDLSVITNTIKYATKIRWGGELNIWVLDDKGTHDLKTIAELAGCHYVHREDAPKDKKSGNLRNAYQLSQGDYFLILDADFVASPDILENLAPYLTQFSKTAICQSTQFFRVDKRQSWIANSGGSIQEFFYRVVQVSRNAWGGAICTGSCALYRRESLKPLNGTALAAHSEDLKTGMFCISTGWNLEFIPLNLSTGLCPDNLKGSFNQNYRWASGSGAFFWDRKFWAAKITFAQRLCYTSGMLFYLSVALSTLIGPLPSIIVLFAYPEKINVLNLVYTLPIILFGWIAVPLWSRYGWQTWNQMCFTEIARHAYLIALWDSARGQSMGWIPSGVKQGSSRLQLFLFILTFWGTLQMVLIVGRSIHLANGQWSWELVPIAALALLNFAVKLWTRFIP